MYSEEIKVAEVGELLKNLKGDELKNFLVEGKILTDNLSLMLIKKIGGLHSPLAVTELPIGGFPRDDALVRLYELEKLGILASSMKKKDDCYVRVFNATPIATEMARLINPL